MYIDKQYETSEKAIKLIKQFEGLRLEAYYDAVNVLTIGYGHTGKDVYVGKVISEQQAEELLRKDLNYFEKAVNELVEVPITQGIFDALVSFSFNVGVGALTSSTLLLKLNGRDYDGAGKELGRWVNGSNGPLEGLKIRRNEEKKLFYSQYFPK